MSDSRIEGYARGLFEIARAEGTIDEVEDELFRFARSYENSDELRAEIARLSAAAVELVVTGSLDAATHQELIENFIAKVGAGVSA
ncbi:MAG TPA: F0F1 ATP synthase subunit delta [Ilumatobacteraceae bacterium]|nr:F0F1 ATP synthase subunit delta [Ilumatobacteraceae bacterium]